MTIGLKGNEVKVVAPDPAWKARFDEEQKELMAILTPIDPRVRIEHTGSTAVTDIKAKPIVDIAVGFSTREQVGPALAAMLKAGRKYLKWGNQPGMLLMGSGNPREVFYHLVVINSPAWIRLVQIRNQLQRFPLIAKEYETLKIQLAKDFKDSRLKYSTAKKPLLSALLGRGLEVVARQRVTKNKVAASERLAGYMYSRAGRTAPVSAPGVAMVVHALTESEKEPR